MRNPRRSSMSADPSLEGEFLCYWCPMSLLCCRLLPPLCYSCYYYSLGFTNCWSKQPISSLSPMGAAGSTANIKRISRACPSGIWREEEEREPNGWTWNRVASRSQARLSPRSPPIYSSCPYNPLPIFQNNSWQAPVTCDHRGSKLCRQYWSCIVISSALTVFQFLILHAPCPMILNFRIPQGHHLRRMTLISLT